MEPSAAPETTTTTEDVDFSSRRVSFAADNYPNEEQQQANIPLLLQPSYVRSKSLIFDELRKFRISLKWCALDHSTLAGKIISYVLFVVLSILVPLFTSLCVKVPSSSPHEDPISFNKIVQLPESGLAIIAFFTICRFFRRYLKQHFSTSNFINM